jgi:N-acetylmuramoyl-L-alanine amidase
MKPGFEVKRIFWKFPTFFLSLLPLFLFPLNSQPPPSAAQREQIKVHVDGDIAHPVFLSGFYEDGLPYGSLDNLTDALGLRTYWNDDVKKLEVRLKKYRLKFTAENPFIVIVDAKTGNVSVHQLPHNIRFDGGKLFAPLTSFLPFLNSLHDRQAALASAELATRVPTRPSTSFDLTGLSVESKLNGYVIRIASARPFDEFESWIKDDGWLYVTVAGARADVEKINKARPTEVFNKVIAIQNPTSAQLTFKLTKNFVGSEILSDPASNDILLSLRLPSEADSVAAEANRSELLSALEGARNRWKLDVIVIDAGHGGEDPGAIGVTRVREKDITLAIALKLGNLIAKNLRDVKVVYTRKSDTFVELYRRGQIANAAGGKLFISIHCNSMRRKPHRQNGFEIYLLRPGRTEDAIQIAERENAVIQLEKGYEKRYQELTEENFILVTMAQSAYVKYSERFAELLREEMGSRLVVSDNGVRQAGFLVLVGASMPNVLIETAYLSNRNDERYLKSTSGQQQIAESIFAAVKRYKSEYEKALEEGKTSN